MRPGVGGQGGPDGGQTVGLPRQVHRQPLIPPPAQGDELGGHRPRLRLHVQDPLLSRLVEAPALGTAGVGPEGVPRPLELSALVDVAQGQVGQAAAGDVLRSEGTVGTLGGGVPVEAAQVEFPVRRGGEARQGAVLLVGGAEGPAPDGAVPIRQGDALHPGGAEDVDLLRPVGGSPHRLLGPAVVVARGDKHRTGHLPQGDFQGPDGLGVDPLRVQQVAGQEDQVGPPVPGQLGQPGGQLPQLLPPPGGPLGAQAGEGAVQMEVGPVDQFHHGRSPLFTPGYPPGGRTGTFSSRYRW